MRRRFGAGLLQDGKKELMEIRFVCRAAVCAIALGLGGCVTLPTSFTTQNVMNVHQGMGSDEILKMFGTPKNVRQAVCGASTGKSWSSEVFKLLVA